MVVVCQTVQIEPLRMHHLLLWKHRIIDRYFRSCPGQCFPIFFQDHCNRIQAGFHIFRNLNINPNASPFLRENIHFPIYELTQQIRIQPGFGLQIIVVHNRSAHSACRHVFYLPDMNPITNR